MPQSADYLLCQQHRLIPDSVSPTHVTSGWQEGNSSSVPYQVNQKVLRKTVYHRRECVNKFGSRFERPYLVKFVNPTQITYAILHWVSGGESRAHHKELKAYNSPPRYLSTHPYFAQRTKRAEPPERAHGSSYEDILRH